MNAAKAWVAALGAFFTALLTEWTNEADDKLTARDIVVALAAGVAIWAAVYFTTNKTSNP